MTTQLSTAGQQVTHESKYPDTESKQRTVTTQPSIQGHIEKACLKKRRGKRRDSKKTPRLREPESDDDHVIHINVNSIHGKQSKPNIVKPTIAGRFIPMELDTCIALSIISKQDYRSTFKDTTLNTCDKTLRS